MRKTTLLLCLALTASAGIDALARGGGDRQATGPAANSQARANSNGRFALDRDKGLERAEDRMSANGRKHEKATAAHERQPRRTAPLAFPLPSRQEI